MLKERPNSVAAAALLLLAVVLFGTAVFEVAAQLVRILFIVLVLILGFLLAGLFTFPGLAFGEKLDRDQIAVRRRLRQRRVQLEESARGATGGEERSDVRKPRTEDAPLLNLLLGLLLLVLGVMLCGLAIWAIYAFLFGSSGGAVLLVFGAIFPVLPLGTSFAVCGFILVAQEILIGLHWKHGRALTPAMILDALEELVNFSVAGRVE